MLAAGAFSYRAATGVDRRNARRMRRRNEDEKRSVARLVHAELSTFADLASQAIKDQLWQGFWKIRDETWVRDGSTLAWQVQEDEFDHLARTYQQIRAWQDRANRFLGPGQQIPLHPGSPDTAELHLIEVNVRECLDQLRRHAFPDGRDVERDPDSEPSWWQIRRLRSRRR